MTDNIKKNLPFLSAGIAIICLVLVLALMMNRQKIGYIDLNLLLSKYDKSVAVRKEISEIMEPVQKQINDLMIDLQHYRNKYQRGRNTLSAAQLKSIEKEFNTKQKEYNTVAQQARAYNSQLESEKMGPIYKELNKYLDEFGKKYGYYMIWSATSAGNLAYANEKANVTEELLKYIEKNPVPGEKPEPAEKDEENKETEKTPAEAPSGAAESGS